MDGAVARFTKLVMTRAGRRVHDGASGGADDHGQIPSRSKRAAVTGLRAGLRGATSGGHSRRRPEEEVTAASAVERRYMYQGGR